jgi:Ohr subfamily peroxiredoxin
MGKTIYTAEAHVTGGRQHGHGRTSDGVLEVDIRPPGTGETGTNPEQLFAVGFAACFGSAMEVMARRQRVELGEYAIDSKVDLQTTEDKGFELAVRFDIDIPGIEDAGQAVELVEAAHKVCPYSRATRGNVDVTFTANGQPVGEGVAAG